MKTEEFEEPEHISIHASAKEATQRIKRFSMLSRFQSTPPRRRRRYEISELKKMFGISIHASAKEATVKMSALGEKLNFNPRLREGGDTSYEANDARHFISIHASAKEATEIPVI